MKTISGALQAHFDTNETTLTTCWRVVRKDGVTFYFTDHNEDIVFEGNTYVASDGYIRTAISQSSDFSIDNMEVEGVIDDDALTADELRNGVFDYATVYIFLVNWADLSQGAMKLRRGIFGEVTQTSTGYFVVELRGLTQPLAQQIMPVYQPECRASFGDDKCQAPLVPPDRIANSTVIKGKYIRVATLAGPSGLDVMLCNLNSDGTNIGSVGDTGSLGTDASWDATIRKFGSGSVRITRPGNPDVASVLSFSGNAAYVPGAGEAFTMSCWVRFASVRSDGCFMSVHDTFSAHCWKFGMVGTMNTLRFSYSSNGSSSTHVDASFSFSLNTWYHCKVTRTQAGVITLYVDDTSVGTGNDSGVAYYSSHSEPFRIGGHDSLGLSTREPLDGWVDDARIHMGAVLASGSGTPPTEEATLIIGSESQEDYENRIYEVTTGGILAGAQPTYDTVVGNTTNDGTAVLTAREAWTRHGVVAAVTDRRSMDITVTEPRLVADWFAGGTLYFETGANKGLSREIKANDTGSPVGVDLFLGFPFMPEVGDKCRIARGCDFRITTCVNVFGNGINFRGEPYVPGLDILTWYAS